MTQTVFYDIQFMRSQHHRMSYEFEKEAINGMSQRTLGAYTRAFDKDYIMTNKYEVNIAIGRGYTYIKYNTLMHFLNVVQEYWRNPDLSNIHVFGKDIRTLIAISTQKIFFDPENHCGSYHYGVLEVVSGGYYNSEPTMDLAVGSSLHYLTPSVSQTHNRRNGNKLVITDRAFEFGYLKQIIEGIFDSANGDRFKADNEVLNLCLLSLMLDFGLYNEKYAGLLNLPFLQDLQHRSDTRELQVEVANRIHEFDRNNTDSSVSRSQVEDLLYECAYKFIGEPAGCLLARQSCQ